MARLSVSRAPGGLDYYTCERTELAKFVKARTGTYVRANAKKSVLVSHLEEADRNPGVFRLMDLPPELRVIVYGEMLTLRPSEFPYRPMACEPTLLRCSKEVHREAAEVLYGDNEVELHLESTLDHGHPIIGYHRTTFIRSAQFRTTHHPRGVGSLRNASFEWPEYLQKMGKIKVVLQLTGRAGGPNSSIKDQLIGIHHLLFSFVSFLGTNKALKKLNVWFDIQSASIADEGLRAALRPLLHMHKIEDFSLTCHSSPTIQQEIKAAISSPISKAALLPRGPRGVLAYANRLHIRAVDFKVLMEGVSHKMSHAKLSSRTFELTELLNTVEFVTERDEERLVYYVNELEEMLTGHVKREVDRAVERKIEGLRSLQKRVDGTG